MTYDLRGKFVGDILVYVKLPRKSRTGRTLWLCKCLCGKEFEAETYTLTARKNKRESCGCCEWHIRHKEAYITWMAMKSRCDNIKDKDYPRYGGKGITYDIKWIKFTEFYKDMSDPPYIRNTNIRLTLDRINNNGNYTKENCRWATLEQQQNNRNNNYCIV